MSPPIMARGELQHQHHQFAAHLATINNKTYGLDYELAEQFADYLGVRLKVTVARISVSCLDLDNGHTDMLAAGLVYNSERVKTIRPDRAATIRRGSWSTGVGNTRPQPR